MPLVNRAGGLCVLFTERSRDLPDHAGQISFPGGRVEPGDADAAAAALREAEEEWVEPPFEVKADPVEVAAVFEVPLSFLLEPANQLRHFRMVGDRRRDYYAIPYGDHYIWGATAAMLLIFDRTLRAS